MLSSLALVLLLGLAGKALLVRARLPGLLGLFLVGLLLGPHALNLLAGEFLSNATTFSTVALVVLLLQAGLGLHAEQLRRVGGTALKMSALPCLFEGFGVMLAGHLLFNMPLIESGMLGFVLAAATPAIIVPAMLKLRDVGRGMDKGIPLIILAGASADDVFAITLFSVFVGLATETGQSIVRQIATIPLQVGVGVLLGTLAGYALCALIRLAPHKIARWDRLGLALALALGVLVIAEHIHAAGLLGVMALGFVVRWREGEMADDLARALEPVWFFAEIVLFVLLGAQVDLAVALGSGWMGLAIIVIGLLARSTGVLAALRRSRLNWKERLFCIIAYTPKATVQAAIGSLPLAMGLAAGPTILAVAALAVVTTASLGALGIFWSAPRLLRQEPPYPSASSRGEHREFAPQND